MAHTHATHTHNYSPPETHTHHHHPQSSQEVAQKAAWASALSRARGDKVLDDPKLLRRSVKRDAKSKERSARKWAERGNAAAEARAAKQEKCVFFVCFKGGVRAGGRFCLRCFIINNVALLCWVGFGSRSLSLFGSSRSLSLSFLTHTRATQTKTKTN